MSTITHEQERTEEQRAYDDEVLERVKRGLAWLEETHGPGWEDKIDLAIFDIGNVNRCVLGQVYKDCAGLSSGYDWAIFNHHLGPVSHGFSAGVEPLHPAWDTLQAAWVDVLTPRVKKEA